MQVNADYYHLKCFIPMYKSFLDFFLIFFLNLVKFHDIVIILSPLALSPYIQTLSLQPPIKHLDRR